MKQTFNKIFWKTGLEITPDTFIQADNYICSQHNLIRRLTAGKSYGLLPTGEADYSVKATVTNKDVCVEQLACCGTTEAGYLIAFDNSLSASLPRKQLSLPAADANAYYVTLRVNPYKQAPIEPVDNEETPEAHSTYELTIRELNQIAADELPIVKIDNGNIANDYIPPCMSVDACSKLLETYETVKILFTEIASIIEHKKYQFGELMYPLTLLRFELDEFSPSEPPVALVKLIKKIIVTCRFFIPDLRTPALGEYCHNDVALIFKSLLSCLNVIKQTVGKEETEEDFTPQI